MISEEILNEIEEHAYNYMEIEEIALIVELSLEDIVHDEIAYKAFLRGRLIRKSEFNGNVIALSKQLSSPAMNIENRISQETYLKDKLRE